MTAIAGIRRSGEVYLATDSLGTSGNLARCHGPKIISGANFSLAFTYSYRAPQLIQRQLGDINPPKKWNLLDVMDFADWCKGVLEKGGAKKEGADDDLPKHPLELIFATKSKLFSIQCDYAVFESKKYLAGGSGREFSYGALHALYGSKLTTKEIAKRSIAAACDHNPYCGGTIHVVKIP